MPAKGKEFLLLMARPSCYSYIQSSPVKVLAVIEETKGKEFLLLMARPSCYSYIQSSPVKILAVIEETKHLCIK
jgi:hypothetical protein